MNYRVSGERGVPDKSALSSTPTDTEDANILTEAIVVFVAGAVAGLGLATVLFLRSCTHEANV